MADSVALRAGEAGKFPKREKKKAETRQKILDASLELYFERNPRDVHPRASGRTRGASMCKRFYRHFPNKDEPDDGR